MKREKKLATALISLFIDDEHNKLCDKYNDLKLSHNRKIKLLKECISYLDAIPGGKYRDILLFRIRQELSYPYFRANYKVKGGKNA